MTAKETFELSRIKEARRLLLDSKFDQALAIGHDLLKDNPMSTDAWRVVGSAQADLGEYDAAISAYMVITRLKPNDVAGHLLLGIVARKAKRLMLSFQSFKKAVVLNPKNEKVSAELGHSLTGLVGLASETDFRDTIESTVPFYQGLIRKFPQDLNFLFQLYFCYEVLAREEDATYIAKKCLEIAPEYPHCQYNYAVCLKSQGKVDEALDLFKKVQKSMPGLTHAHYAVAQCYLTKKNYQLGWDLFEIRWDDPRFNSTPLKSNLPMWQGEKGKRVIIWGEQGLGDEIQYASMVNEAAALCTELTVACDARLHPLFQRSFNKNIKYVSRLKELDQEAPFDMHLPIASLGRLFRPDSLSFADIPSSFLKSDNELTAQLRADVTAGDSVHDVVGISWFSSSCTKGRLHRRIDPVEMIKALDKPGRKFVCLQYGDVDQDLKRVKTELGIDVYNPETIDQFSDIDGLSSLICSCDLVVTGANITSQISGGLGVSTVVLLPLDASWMWGADEVRNDWYPSISLIRQKTKGSWADTIKALKKIDF